MCTATILANSTGNAVVDFTIWNNGAANVQAGSYFASYAAKGIVNAGDCSGTFDTTSNFSVYGRIDWAGGDGGDTETETLTNALMTILGKQ